MNTFHFRRWFLYLVVAANCGFFGEACGQPAPVSEFTTTDPKKVKIIEDSALEKEPEIDHFKHLCPGLGGYQILHEGGDLRSWINLRYDGKVTDLMNDTLSACPGQFPAKTNHVVQWRGLRVGKTFVPYAIIFRMTASHDSGEKPSEARPSETLIVIKLDKEKSRVVGQVASQEGNGKAEALADRLCRP